MTSRKEQRNDPTKTSSRGHKLAGGAYLDKHFECMRPEYEAMVRAAGIQSGWRVLDAGAGSGSFLPLIDELVGEAGHIDALDLAPENVQMIKQRLASERFRSNIEPQQGSVLDLPYESQQCDLVWCANVTQYLDDDELTQMLREMYRVTRPGGLVAIKEADLTACRICAPLDPQLLWHLLEAGQHIQQMASVLRTTNLPRWFRNAGFEVLSYQTYLGERRHPLTAADVDFFTDILRFWGNYALELGLPEEELVHWRRFINPDAPDYLLKDPDFYLSEAMALVIGQVPASRGNI